MNLWLHRQVDREFKHESTEYVTDVRIEDPHVYYRRVTTDKWHPKEGDSGGHALMRCPYTNGQRWFREFTPVPAITAPGGSGLL